MMGLSHLSGSSGSGDRPEGTADRNKPRLLELSLRGFKSFAAETTIRFAPTITGIVGPNGSGKSNIVDALRWISGERSRQAYRVSQISDVVHVGPRGQLGWSRVSMRIDPSGCLPWTEVSLERTLYSDGTQVFLLNGAKVRLMDIETTLERLGVLSFIVGQGEVEWLLELRPLELRQRLEVALGLGAIKVELAKARESLKAIQETLVQLSASRSELVPHFRTLDRLVRQGQEWHRLEMRAKQLTAQAYSWKLRAIQTQLQETQSALAYVEGELANLQAELGTTEEARAVLEAEMAAVEAEFEDVEKQLRNCEIAQAADEARLQVLHNAQSETEARVAELEKQLDRLSVQATSAFGAIAKAGELRERLQVKLETLEEALHGLDQEVTALLTQRDALRGTDLAEVSNLELEATRVREQLRGAQKEQAILSEQLVALRQSMEAAAGRLRSLQDDLSSVRQRQDTCEREMTRLLESIACTEQRIEELEAAREAEARSIQLLDKKLDGMRGEIARFRDRLAREADMPRAVSEVMAASNKGELSGIVGPVVHLLQVPEQYSVAIWAAIGGRRWSLVARTWHSAVAAVELLRRRRVGRATFLPLDTIKAAPLTTPGPLPGLVGHAVELVRVSADLRPVVDLLLGRVLVVEDLKAARTILGQAPGFTLVTLAGDMVRATGEITGGWNMAGPETPLLRAKLSQLEHQEATLAAQRAQSAARHREAERALADLRTKLGEDRSRFAALETELQVQRALLHRLEEERRSLLNDAATKEKQYAELLERNSTVEAELERLKEELQRTETRLMATRVEQAEALTRVRELDRRVQDLTSEIRTLNGSKSMVLRDLEAAERELAGWEVRLSETQAARERAESELAQLRARLLEIAAGLESLGTSISLRAAEIQALLGRRESLSNQLSCKSRQIQDYEGRLMAIRESTKRLRMDRDRLNAELEHLRAETAETELRAREELGRAWPELLDGAQVEDPQKELAEVRERQRRLVLPDPEVEAEHREVGQRLHNIDAQIADISSAAEALASKIDQLESRARSGWDAGILLLGASLRHTWLDLFGGGSAELVVDSEGGVRLEANPPGKRLKSVASLSGGERALASMALLLSMLEVGAFPVCVLDEVDAALDDVRAARLAGLIRRLAPSVQFVIVTHNRHTIQACEVLYGLSVDGDGGTKVLSLKLSES